MNVFSTTTDNKLTDGMLVLVENVEQMQEYQRTNLDNRFSDAFQIGIVMNTNGTYPFAIEDMNVEGTFAIRVRAGNAWIRHSETNQIERINITNETEVYNSSNSTQTTYNNKENVLTPKSTGCYNIPVPNDGITYYVGIKYLQVCDNGNTGSGYATTHYSIRPLSGTIGGEQLFYSRIDGYEIVLQTSDSITDGVIIGTVAVVDGELEITTLTDLLQKAGVRIIADDVVGEDNIKVSAITTNKIAGQAVTTGKLADLGVTTGKMANGSVTTEKLGADSVTTEKIADNVGLGGSPTTTTQPANDNSTKIATTAFVQSVVGAVVDSYGVCSTAGNVSAKVVTMSSFSLYTGVRISIKFENANEATNPTLNINASGGYGIILFNGISNRRFCTMANDIIDFIFDGSNWICQPTHYVPDYETSMSKNNDTDYVANEDLFAFYTGVGSVVNYGLRILKDGILIFDTSHLDITNANGTNIGNYVTIPRGSTYRFVACTAKYVYILKGTR